MDASGDFRAFWSHFRFASSHDRAALRWTDSSMYVSVSVCGVLTAETYSKCGHMRVWYAVDFIFLFVYFDIPIKEA